VEASPEQLASAMAVAEKLSERNGTKIRVIGWYHSHPHITVLPSHVDVRTQASYQMLDEGFIGIILSTFNEACPAS
jgi:BRCA1/BRCA2-containing complex subunit 3